MKTIKLPKTSISLLRPGYVPSALWVREYEKLIENCGTTETLTISAMTDSGTVITLNKRVFCPDSEYAELNRNYVRVQTNILYSIIKCDTLVIEKSALFLKPVFDELQKELEIAAVVFKGEEDIAKTKLNPIRYTVEEKGFCIGIEIDKAHIRSASVINEKTIFSEEIEWDSYSIRSEEQLFSQLDCSISRAIENLPQVENIICTFNGAIGSNNQILKAGFLEGHPTLNVGDSNRVFVKLRNKFSTMAINILPASKALSFYTSRIQNDEHLLMLNLSSELTLGYSREFIPDLNNSFELCPLALNPKTGALLRAGQVVSADSLLLQASKSGISFTKSDSLYKRLIYLQGLLNNSNRHVKSLLTEMGCCLAYSIALLHEFYNVQRIMLTGAITSGPSGDLICQVARNTLMDDFPGIARITSITMPSERDKRHGLPIHITPLRF